MTTEQPDAALGASRSVGTRRLRRRTSDRVISGVAGGIGDYLNLDPVLLRAGFAGLMIFGGAGLVLYVLGWLLIPAQGQEESIAEATIRWVGRRVGRFGAAALVLLAIVVVSPGLTGYGGSFFFAPEVFWALAVAIIGVVLLLPRDRLGSEQAAPIATDATIEQSASVPSAVWAAPARRPRERSPLGWYVLAGVLLLVGALAVAGNVAAVNVAPGQFFGVGLIALGIGLAVGAWWGRARPLIFFGLILIPLAATSAFLTVPLEGGIGDHEFRPQTLGEVKPEYRLIGGDIRIDLTDLETGSGPIAIDASVGIGNLVVIVPADARVEVDARVEGGRLSLFGRQHAGTGLVDRVEQAGRAGGPAVVLNLASGLGWIRVDRAGQEEF
jgi:phage shock protein PspC (stress-responsive transcriptional regulator)